MRKKVATEAKMWSDAEVGKKQEAGHASKKGAEETRPMLTDDKQNIEKAAPSGVPPPPYPLRNHARSGSETRETESSREQARPRSSRDRSRSAQKEADRRHPFLH